MTHPTLDEIACRLIRTDGTEWQVTDLRADGLQIVVDAVPWSEAGEAERDGNRDDRPTLEAEPLRRDDRVRWEDDAGTVVWSMRVPVGRPDLPA